MVCPSYCTNGVCGRRPKGGQGAAVWEGLASEKGYLHLFSCPGFTNVREMLEGGGHFRKKAYGKKRRQRMKP